MGTRGFYGVVFDGDTKITYNHFDSYPDGLGTDILKQVSDLVKDLAKLHADARRLALVDEDSTPTLQQIQDLQKYWDPNVSTGSAKEWYSLLRNMQGDLAAHLGVGVMIDSGEFPMDSLFCEWGYLVDLDRHVLEVYEGFQKESPTEGRWAGRPNTEDRERIRERCQKLLDVGEINDRQFEYATRPTEYHAVQKVAEFPLDDLPSEEIFLLTFSEEDEDA